MQTRLRRRLTAVALVAAAPLVASCGFDVQTDQVYQPASGANNRSSQVDVLGAVVVADQPGSGRFLATFVNESESRPDAVTQVVGRGLKVESFSPVRVPVYNAGFANLADSQYPELRLDGDVDAGGYVTLRFTFADADPVTMRVPVVDPVGPYAGYAPDQGSTAASQSGAGNDVAAQGSDGAFQTGGPTS